MECPNCKSRMIEGMLMNHGMGWMVKPGKFMQSLVKIGGKTMVIAWKCPNCKKVELAVE